LANLSGICLERAIPRFRGALLTLVLAASIATGLAGSSWGSPGRPHGLVPVIVQAQPGSTPRAAAAVRGLGGVVGRRLPIIQGFGARVPRAAVETLRHARGVRAVTLDSAIHAETATYSPTGDVNSMASTTQYTGAQAWWNAGYTGAGVDVAVIDSGVSPVEGLDDPGKVVNGPDLSAESQAASLALLDTYGHGTFMAGLIAGHDTALADPYSASPATVYRGMAPDARIVSLKVASADGGTDVSQVIAAIDWVVQHAHDPGLNIRVLNLSYGTNSTQAYAVDPLAFAAEQAWRRGIVVVAAAGNTGYQRGSGAPGLADPAYDPFVIAVGASDSAGTASINDDKVGSFSASSSGCGSCKNPDFLAPGAHIQGLRVPGSWLDANHPEGVVDARYFRGSGTSQAAAILSGAAALVLQRYPSLTPDALKRYFADNAQKVASYDSQAQGAGEIRLGQMLAKAPPSSAQKFTAAAGNGQLEGSRGTDHLMRDGVALTGEKDIFGKPVDTAKLASGEAAGSSWSGGAWNGSTWSGSSWSGSSWSGSSWSGSSWSGSSWSGSTWSGSSWSGSSWSGSSWSGSSWSGSSWSGKSWADASWG
jgi:serine protease AprX